MDEEQLKEYQERMKARWSQEAKPDESDQKPVSTDNGNCCYFLM